VPWASEWAVELQPTYAPELTFAGAALGGLTPNVTNVLRSTNHSMFSWRSFAGLNGLAKAYPNISAFLQQNLMPTKAAEFYSINNLCSNDSQAEKRLSYQDVATYFQGGFSALEQPVPQSVITWGATMGKRSTPTVPLYVYKAIGDEISPIADTDALLKQYRAGGTRITYRRNLVGEHVSDAILGSGGAFGWLIDRMEGKPVVGGCNTSTVFVSSVDGGAFVGFSAEIIGALRLLLNLPLGPGPIKGL
jgi:hypothetical protein